MTAFGPLFMDIVEMVMARAVKQFFTIFSFLRKSKIGVWNKMSAS